MRRVAEPNFSRSGNNDGIDDKGTSTSDGTSESDDERGMMINVGSTIDGDSDGGIGDIVGIGESEDDGTMCVKMGTDVMVGMNVGLLLRMTVGCLSSFVVT